MTPMLHCQAVDEELRITKYGCEGTTLFLECQAGKLISPVRANYGRFDSGICNAERNLAWSTRCIQPTTLRQVNSICQGKTSCAIHVTSGVFGEPCADTYKYLEVHYTCTPQLNNTQQHQQPPKNLPPWLLKMSATTARSVSTSTTTATTTTMTSTVAPVDTMELVDPLDLVQEVDADYKLEDNSIDLYTLDDILAHRRQLFVNLPLASKSPLLDAQIKEVEEEEEEETVARRTLLIVLLLSIISCSAAILVSSLLYIKLKHRRNTQQQNALRGISDSLTTNYHTNYSQLEYSLFDHTSLVSDTNSANTTLTSTLYDDNVMMADSNCRTLGSVYTWLPNGDRAVVIPMSSEYLRQLMISASGVEQMKQLSNTSQHKISASEVDNMENIYTYIG